MPASPVTTATGGCVRVAAQHPAEALQLAAAADELRPRHVLR